MQIFVLGMHRSGTSMACRLVNLMGAYFGPEGCQHAPNEENPRGFWERKDFRALNDDLLAAGGATWDDCAHWSPDRLPAEQRTQLQRRAGELVFRLEAFRPWVTKEPRFCLTFPLFRAFCDVPVAVLVLRRPQEVCASLAARNGFAAARSYALWHTYVSAALDGTADCPRIIVHHHDLLAQPVAATRALLARLEDHGVRGLRQPSEREINAFISPGLYRARDVDEAPPTDVANLYQGLLEATGNPGLQ